MRGCLELVRYLNKHTAKIKKISKEIIELFLKKSKEVQRQTNKYS